MRVKIATFCHCERSVAIPLPTAPAHPEPVEGPPFILSLSKDPPVVAPWRGVRGVRREPYKPRTMASRLSSARLMFSWLLAYDSRT